MSADLLEMKMARFKENSFVCLGPGAKAGLARVFTVNSNSENLELTKQLTRCMDKVFQELNIDFQYFLGRKLTLKTIEHALCEFDKYWRTTLGKIIFTEYF